MEIPEGIAALGPEAQERVRELLDGARRRQQEDLRKALEETLRLVPKPLHGVVRRVLGA